MKQSQTKVTNIIIYIQNSKPYISIDNIDFQNQKQTLNSPRTLEACNQLGVEPEELYYHTLQEYINIHPEVLSLDKELQQYRYEHMEQYRKET